MSIYFGTTKINKVGSTAFVNRIFVGGVTAFGGGGGVVDPVAPTFIDNPSPSQTGATVGIELTINSVASQGTAPITTTYRWIQNSSVIGSATSQSYTPSVTGPLLANVTITNNVGSTGATVDFGTIVPAAPGNFAPSFTGIPSGSTTNPDVGERMTFLNYGSTGQPGPTTSFQWYDDGAAISGATGYGYVLGATGELTDASKTIQVEVSMSGFEFDDVLRPDNYPLTRGVEYIFDLSNASSSHPLRLSTTENGTKNGGTQYTDGWTIFGTQGQPGSYAQFIVGATAPDTLWYYCPIHSNLGNSIAVTTVPATDVTMTGNLTGVVTLTNSEGTTGATVDFGTMINADIESLILSNAVAGATLTATVTYGGTAPDITWSGVTS